jgi:hypothetical protein
MHARIPCPGNRLFAPDAAEFRKPPDFVPLNPLTLPAAPSQYGDLHGDR